MKRILILIIVTCSVVSLFAKENTGKNSHCQQREQIESRRVAFISTEIGISPEEATVFWPAYNSFHEELKAVHVDTRNTFKSISKLSSTENYPKSEMEKLIKRFITNKEKEISLQKDFYNSLSGILPIEKVAKFIIAEEEFRRQMIRMWKKPHSTSEEKQKNQKK